jgi:hypothetical protein
VHQISKLLHGIANRILPDSEMCLGLKSYSTSELHKIVIIEYVHTAYSIGIVDGVHGYVRTDV